MSLRRRRHHLTMDNFFLIHRWYPEDMPYVLYTEEELRTLHQIFGHPSVRALQMFSERAIGSKMERNTVKSLEKMKKNCTVCKKTSIAPRRFKLIVGTAGLKFNHRVQVDAMFIHGIPVIHILDEVKHFCVAFFLRNQSTKEIWN